MYGSRYSNKREDHSITVDTVVFDEFSAVTVRYDLLDPCIYICAPEVLAGFTDNFDYVDMEVRRDTHARARTLGWGCY